MGRLLLLLLPLYVLSSCSTQQRIPNYLQNVSDTTRLGRVDFPQLRIQKNDQLSIQVFSASTKREISDAPFNLPATASTDAATQGYLVDAEGNIEYPMLGFIKAEGLTRQELADVIKRKINENDSVLYNPSVVVRFLNLRVTVLGEVGKQGIIQFPGERVNIMEAIGLAGGITEFGLKNNIKVIREANGEREVGILDLSSDTVFHSRFYNLMQNDLVLVDPAPRKAKKTEQEAFFRQAGFVISIITATAVVIRLFQ
ncbi:MAG: polysaccharide biosynthesis/export family protein [Chitinophagaceae bacterium]|nr:polysaccharide biosynthesis/export family protein [Chitinophagaceae bacterium]